MAGSYRSDLAYIHDAGFGDLARGAASVLRHELRRRGLTGGLVIDLGCGSGILAEAMLASGYDVLGIDVSKDMIALARKRAPAARFRRESLWVARLEPCVAVAAIGECLNYLSLSRSTQDACAPRSDRPPASREARLFRNIFDALQADGILLFDILGPEGLPQEPRRTFIQGDDWAVLTTTSSERRRSLLARRITSFRRVGDLYRRDDEVHRQRPLQVSVMNSYLRAAGFTVRNLSGYAEAGFLPGRAGFLARKP